MPLGSGTRSIRRSPRGRRCPAKSPLVDRRDECAPHRPDRDGLERSLRRARHSPSARPPPRRQARKRPRPGRSTLRGSQLVCRPRRLARSAQGNRDPPLRGVVLECFRLRSPCARRRVGNTARAAAPSAGHIAPVYVGNHGVPIVDPGVTYANAVSNGWILKDGNGTLSRTQRTVDTSPISATTRTSRDSSQTSSPFLKKNRTT